MSIFDVQSQCVEKLGFNPMEVEQGSPEWHKARMGVVTASNAICLLSSFDSDTFKTYVNKLVGQIITGRVPAEIKARSLQWGKDNEPGARRAFSVNNDLGLVTVKDIGFLYRDLDMRVGISPDGHFVHDGIDYGLELKCPVAQDVYVDYAYRKDIKKSEIAQVQMSLWVTDWQSWYFAKYDPRVQLGPNCVSTVIERDERMISDLRGGYFECRRRVDQLLGEYGIQFGDHYNIDYREECDDD